MNHFDSNLTLQNPFDTKAMYMPSSLPPLKVLLGQKPGCLHINFQFRKFSECTVFPGQMEKGVRLKV